MNAVHQRLDYFDKTIDALLEQVARHATEIAQHNERLSGLETRVGAIQAFITELAEKTPREREPIPRIPELRPEIVIPEFGPRLPDIVIDPRPKETLPDLAQEIDVKKEETTPPNIVPKLGPSITIPELRPLINNNDKDKNGDNNF
jgi:uncharacterized coiled-coil protein SlyX